MPDLDLILEDLVVNWWLYLLMPTIAAAIGYVTKLVAIEMMFRPLNYVGIRPFGWQGVVPAQAKKMAQTACATLTSDLIKPEEMFSRLDPVKLAAAIQEPMLEMIDELVREVAAAYEPGLWESLPEIVRKQMIKRVQAAAPEIIAEMMQDMQRNLDKIFDFEAMVISAMSDDPEQLNRMFLTAGAKEMAFIRNSGIYFGFGIGVIQAVVWALTHNPWVIPIFGGLTGWLSDWLALKMIFEPRKPGRLFGILPWHGLFLKRRDEVAIDYGTLVADEVLTPANMIRSILSGPSSDRLYDLVQKHVKKAVDEQAGLARPLMVYRIGSRNYQDMKTTAARHIIEQAPDALKHVQAYAYEAMDLRNTLIEKCKQLSDEDFESLLRPIFKAEEWKLIAAGAVLGFMVGELQVQVMIPFMTAVGP
ncbi:MAG: DUF445 domain-containing protein [Panacagrimonas sp.]